MRSTRNRTDLSSATVGILLPVKQYRPDFLAKALTSVFQQSDPHWKLSIIVEKSERDHFAAILSRELQDLRVDLIVNAGRRIGGALNTGMRHARSAFVGILFADDMWAPEAVAVLRRAIKKNPKADFFHSSRIIIDESDEPISTVHYSKASFRLKDFEKGSPVKHLLCWRRTMGLAVGGIDESHSHGPDDYDFPWTMAEAGARFYAIREALYIYRDHRAAYRLTTHIPLSSQKWALRKILKKHGIAPDAIDARVEAAERGYLKQCLFATPNDEEKKTKAGYNAQLGWRDTYQ